LRFISLSLRRTSVRLGKNPCAALIIEKISPSGFENNGGPEGKSLDCEEFK